MAAKKPQVRFNNDLRKAVHSGDGYSDYMTVYQFLVQKLNGMKDLLRRSKHFIQDFYLEGGEVRQEDKGVFHASIDGVDLRIVFDGDGDVSEYSVTGIKRKKDVAKRILNLFFYEHLIPMVEDIILTTEEQLKDMDNDNTLRGLSELRDIIRGDKYLTSMVVSGVEIATEEDRNELFSLLEDDE